MCSIFPVSQTCSVSARITRLALKPWNKRIIIPLQKNCYFAIIFIGCYFFDKSIQKHPDSVCENDVNNEQNVCTYYYVKPLNKRLITMHLLLKKSSLKDPNKLKLGSSAGSSSSAIVAPFASAAIRPVVNWLNQDTTVYNSLVFCSSS